MEWLIEIDAEILIFLQNNVRNAVFTPLIRMITVLGNGGVFWILASLVLLIPDKTRKTGIAAIAALLVSLLINNLFLKNLVARIRPYEVVVGLEALIPKPWGYSFPSGHTGSSFAAAWVFYRELPKRFGIPALVLAGAIGFSRLYLGVHYPTDVCFGVISGIGSGYIALLLIRAVTDRFGKQSV